MATVSIDLTFEQLLAAVQKLPKRQKMQLWQMLDSGLNRDGIRRRARAAVETIWVANEEFNEDEVMADVEETLREVRAEETARRP